MIGVSGFEDLMRLQALGDKPAIISKTGLAYSYSDLVRCARDIRRILDSRGVVNRRIGVLVADDVLHVMGLLAMGQANTMVPINPSYRREKLPAFLFDLSIDVLLTDDPASFDAAGICRFQIGLDSGGVRCDRTDGPAPTSADGMSQCTHALIIPTSGTTGKPKLVGYSEVNVAMAVRANIEHFRLSPDDVYLCPMPLFHAHGLVSVCIFTLSAGGTIVLCSADPQMIAESFEKYRPTCFSAAPTIHQGLLRRYRGKKLETGALRFVRSSSAPLQYAIFDQLEALYGCPLVETYGLTESTSVVVANDLSERRKGSVGRPIGATEAAVLTDHGVVRSGSGELLLRGPCIINGYLDVPCNPQTHVDGWFRTGDIAEIDSDGFICISGRLKEVVKRGGYGISPAEVDNALCAIPGIIAACSFSLPHRTLGEELVSVIEINEDHVFSHDQIIDVLFEVLPTYKIPSAIRVVHGIPRSAIGKIVRSSVKMLFAEVFAEAYHPAASRAEELLVDFWQKNLPDECVGVGDNLILKGVDPLLVSELKGRFFGLDLSTKFLLRNPTIRQQAALIDGVIVA